MSKYFFFTIVAISLFSCNKASKTENLAVETQIFAAETYFIRPSQLYNTDIISRAFIDAQGTETLEQKSNEALLHVKKAIELEKTNPKQSIHWYQKALTCFPSSGIYTKIGDLLSNIHEQQEAKAAYQTALFILKNEGLKKEEQGFDTKSTIKAPKLNDIYQKTIKATIESQKYDEAVQMLTEAYENGYISKEFILQDESMKSLRNHESFKLFSTLNLVEGSQKAIVRRDYFLENFPKVTLPYNLAPTPPKKNEVNYYEEYEMFENPILNKYKEELLPKNVYDIQHIAKLHEANNYTLLLSAFDTTSFESVTDEFRTFSYLLFTLDKQGNIVDKLSTAYRTPFIEAACTITENNIEIRYADRKWKNMDYFKARKNNEFLGLQATVKKTYIIGSDGKFVEKTE